MSKVREKSREKKISKIKIEIEEEEEEKTAGSIINDIKDIMESLVACSNDKKRCWCCKRRGECHKYIRDCITVAFGLLVSLIKPKDSETDMYV
jgi:sugar-specific transcriptional regulator TrmB